MNPKFKGNKLKDTPEVSRVIEDKEFQEYMKTPIGKLSWLKINLESIREADIPIFKNAKSHFVINMIADSTNERLEELIDLVKSLRQMELDK